MCDLHSDSDDIPSDIEDAARNAVCLLIPEKFKAAYDLVSEKFEKWRKEKKVKHVNEKVLLAYFEDKNLKASTLWTHYSMLRTELSLKKVGLILGIAGACQNDELVNLTVVILRISSATLLEDAGVNIMTIKRHAGWKSTTVAEGYVENSIENKTKIANQVLV
ncbi:hypothetical protein NQ317_000958, partial [Molorchus minor]